MSIQPLSYTETVLPKMSHIEFLAVILISLTVSLACSTTDSYNPQSSSQTKPVERDSHTTTLNPTHSPSSIEPSKHLTSNIAKSQLRTVTFVLQVSEIADDLPNYDRGDWRHWTDDDKDCRNTRHETLIDESRKEVTFKTSKHCQVATGEWVDPYTATTLTEASKLDVDHMVPLKNAHDSGGWKWDQKKKSMYANDMRYDDHLIAVTARANRQKGSKGPDEWKPENQDYWCEYALDWIQIKVDWQLTVTNREFSSLEEMVRICSHPISLTSIDTSITD